MRTLLICTDHMIAGQSLRSSMKRWGGSIAVLLVLAFPLQALATSLDEYLLIGTGPQSTIGTSSAVSNFELGANSVAVPMSGLAGSVPALPAGAETVFVGIGGNGDVANTHFDGNFDVSNIDIWGDTGIDCTGPLSTCNTGLSNTNFNGSAMTTSNGLNGNVDLSGVTADLALIESTLPTIVGDFNITLDFSSDGLWDTDLVLNLAAGLTVIDFDTGGNDLSLSNANLLIDGVAGSSVIFRLPDNANFLVSQANIVVGTGGIGLNSAVFYTDKPDNNQHVNVNDAIINGVAFWDLSSGGEVTFNNVQGCTQIAADKINLNDVRLNNCGPGISIIPEPGTGLLMGLGLAALSVVNPRGSRMRRS